MGRHDPITVLRQILSHSQEAVMICGEKNREDLDSDRLLNLALTRLVEIIGEAAKRIPDDIQAKYPQLPWMQMIGARNHMIHGYDSIDLDIFWAIVKNDLPPLISQLDNILNSDQINQEATHLHPDE